MGTRGSKVVRFAAAAGVVLGMAGGLLVGTASAGDSATVDTESEFRAAWSNASVNDLTLAADITLTCSAFTPVRNSVVSITVDGDGHTLRNTCTSGDHALMRSAGTGNVIIEDIRLTGGRSLGFKGGAVQVTNADLTIDDAVVTANTSVSGNDGGAISGDGGTVLVRDSIVSSNSTAGDGAAISSNTDVQLVRSTVAQNTLSDEAVISDGTVTVDDSVISGNDADGFFAGATATISGSTIGGNADEGARSTGNMSATDSTISGNGGRGLTTSSTLTVTRSTVHGNGGSGVQAGNGVNLFNATITANLINVVNQGGTFDPFGSIIAEATGVQPNCSVGTTISIGGNTVDDSTCNVSGGEVETDPLLLGPLQPNGGPTATRTPQAASPAVDRILLGDCSDGGLSEVDQRGFSRPANGACDSGAVERCIGGTFSDVPLTSPFARDICWMGVQGITTGFPNGTYKPTASVTREAMSAFMYRLAGEPPFVDPGTPTFSDVPASSTFFSEIEWMADEGITTGFPGGLYKPADPVKRQSMSAFMYRLAGSPPFVDPGTPTFSDVGTGHPFYTEVEWMADEGITTGFPGGTYRPDDDVSRQAMSAFMRRLAEGPGVGI